MLTFKDLVIKANDTQIEEFIERVTNKISGYSKWCRKEDKESRTLGYKKVYAFQREEDNELPSAGLSIFPKEAHVSWYVPNVVPIKNGRLPGLPYPALHLSGASLDRC